MTDQYGRNIDYLRISVTDRCNLRCRYCTPVPFVPAEHEDILQYEEILRLARLAVRLGITKFKVTGGEPLTRKGCVEFVAALKATDGVEQVTMTTNGLLLAGQLDALTDAGLDAVNISLDTLDPEKYRAITGYGSDGVAQLLELLEACCRRGLRTKLNAVLLEENQDEIPALAAIAGRLPVDVRFIELMPIGCGSALRRVEPDRILGQLRAVWPDLHPTQEVRGNGPAHYFASDALQGCIGLIDAVSHQFCESCNRVRLTSQGLLKPCLCYDTSTDLRSILRSGGTDEQLLAAMERCIGEKPEAHCFTRRDQITERKNMSEIGG